MLIVLASYLGRQMRDDWGGGTEQKKVSVRVWLETFILLSSFDLVLIVLCV